MLIATSPSKAATYNVNDDDRAGKTRFYRLRQPCTYDGRLLPPVHVRPGLLGQPYLIRSGAPRDEFSHLALCSVSLEFCLEEFVHIAILFFVLNLRSTQRKARIRTSSHANC